MEVGWACNPSLQRFTGAMSQAAVCVHALEPDGGHGNCCTLSCYPQVEAQLQVAHLSAKRARESLALAQREVRCPG